MNPVLAPQREFIDGEFAEVSTIRTDATGAAMWIEHASTGQPVLEQRRSDDAAIERALSAAQRVHESGEWSAMPVGDRAEVLEAVANELEARVGSIAAFESAESGATISTTSMLGFIVHAAFRLAAAQIRSGVLEQRFDGPAGAVEVRRVPFGPALMLCPWNAPAPMAAHKAASALAVGAPVIIKPPERAPHGTEMMAEAFAALGVMPGLFQIVHGGPEVAASVMNDPRIRAVSFTGGLAGGRAVAHACAEGIKSLQLELGGHSPLLVVDDAEPAVVAEAATGLLTTLNGQWCRALGRLLLPASRADEYLEAIVAALGAVTIGDPLDANSQMGPIVCAEHRSMLQGVIEDAKGRGATVVAPTSIPDRPGNWMSPTLLCGLDTRHTVDEMFGPIAAVHTYQSDSDGVDLANGTEYGLEAYVVGADTDRAMALARRIRAGGVKVNGVSPISLNLMAPRPAFGISGLGEEGTLETMWCFAGNQVVGVEDSLGKGQ